MSAKKKRIVLLGRQGSGKTTLFNKLTQSSQPTKWSGGSLTKSLVMAESKHGLGFQVIDTPGFDVSADKVLHAAGIVAGLTYGQLNRIVIVVKCSRNDDVKRDIQMVYKVIQRYQANTTIYFSCSDLLEDPKKEKQQLEEFVKQNFNFASILYGDKTSDPKNIIYKFDNEILANSNFIDVKLLDIETAQISDYIKFEKAEDFAKLENIKQSLTEKFHIYSMIILKFIDNLKPEEIYFLEILHQLQFYVKISANQVLQEFEKDYGSLMNLQFEINSENNQYLNHIVLSKQLFSEVEQIQRKINNKMQSHKDHIYRYLRECPKCGEIWMKVVGCSQVTCGREVGLKYDKILKIDIKSRIVFEIQGNNLTFKIDKREPIGSEDEVKNMLQTFFDNGLSKEIKEKLNLKDFTSFLQLLKDQIVGEDYLMEWSQKLERDEKEDFLKRLHEILLYQTQNKQEGQLNKVQNLGCGTSFNWDTEGKLISQQKSITLLSLGLIDFFSDQEKLISDETKLLAKSSQQLLEIEIENQKKYLQQSVNQKDYCQIF